MRAIVCPNIFRLLQDGAPSARRPIYILAGLTGIGNAGLVGLINQAAEKSFFGEEVGLQLLIVYVLTLLFFLLSNRLSLHQANQLVQSRLEATRCRIVNKMRRADLRTLERLGHGDAYVTVAQETDHLSQTLPLLIGAAQSVLLIVFVYVYIATLSLISFFVVTGFTILGIFLFLRRQNAMTGAIADVHHREAEMLETLVHFTQGFSEIRLNAKKNDELFARFSNVVNDLREQVLEIGWKWVGLLQFSNAFIFALMGVVVFVLPIFFEGYTDTIYKITAACVFVLGPIAAVVSVVRLIGRAEAGLGHVYALEKRLDEGGEQSGENVQRDRSPFRNFSKIEFEGVLFDYIDRKGDATFRAGPFDFSVRRGETIFLTGGNGSGKSTVLKLLCGLYSPDQGRILCDDEEIESGNRQEYREIFSAIFADFHLFDRLYGYDDVDPADVERLIEKFGLSDKVGFENGGFTTRELSTGQRKRLAMIVAIIEDREVYILDEWAADQDANFRDFFYTELLADFKARGKTVVAVTHDDHYWNCCDSLLRLDLGRITAVGP